MPLLVYIRTRTCFFPVPRPVENLSIGLLRRILLSLLCCVLCKWGEWIVLDRSVCQILFVRTTTDVMFFGGVSCSIVSCLEVTCEFSLFGWCCLHKNFGPVWAELMLSEIIPSGDFMLLLVSLGWGVLLALMWVCIVLVCAYLFRMVVDGLVLFVFV